MKPVIKKLLLLALLHLALPDAVWAGFTFTTNNDGSLTLVNETPNSDLNISVPSTIGGRPVTSISAWAFYHSHLNIEIPSTVTNLAAGAFVPAFNYVFVNTNSNFNIPNGNYNVPYTPGVYFDGNAPASSNVFSFQAGSSLIVETPTVYYLPGTTGWGTNFNGRQTQVWSPFQLQMFLSPTWAITGGAQWRVDDSAWLTNGAIVGNLSAGNHTVGFKPVQFWKTPDDEIINVGTNFITTYTAASYQGGPFEVLLPFGSGTLIVSSNNLYGTVSNTIFTINLDGTDFTKIYSFTNSPTSSLTRSDDISYGTVNYSGGGFNFICSTNMNYSPSGLILSDNTFYGTQPYGGAGDGELFSVNTDGSGFTVLHTFGGVSDGSFPNGLVLSGSTLYGTTFEGYPSGSPFSIQTNGSGYIFYPNYSHYPAGMILSGNTLYGTSLFSVFQMNTNGSGFTTITSQVNTEAGVILAGNTLYGTSRVVPGTQYSSDPGYYGSIFAVHTDGTGFTNLYYFNGSSNGAYPNAGVVLSGTTLYGTTPNSNTPSPQNNLPIYNLGTTFMLSFPPPQLTITPSGTNLILTWPSGVSGAGYDNFFVQSTTNLVAPMTWSTVSALPVLVNELNTVTNSVTGTPQYFRLSQ